MKSKTISTKNNKQVVYKIIFDILAMMFVSSIAGLAFKNFFESQGIIPAGLTGLSLIFHNLFQMGDINIPTSVVYLIMNAILLALAFKNLGWKFIILSSVGILFHSITMQFGAINPLIDAIDDKLLATLIGAIIYGVAIGLAFRIGGSTGGSDIAGAIVNSYFPRIKTGYCIMGINILVIAITTFTNGLTIALYALIITVLSSMTTNFVLDSSKMVVAFYIVCDKDEEISQAIMKRFNRGVTKINATGVFSQQNKSMLLCLVPNINAREMKKIIKEIDKDAFVFSSAVTETLGEGSFMKEANAFKNKIKKAKKNVKSEVAYKRFKLKSRKRIIKPYKKLWIYKEK